MQRRPNDSESGNEPQEDCRPGSCFEETDEGKESVAGARVIAGRTANDSPDSMALSITCHAQITNLEGNKVLACGVDSLYLSLYVNWDDDWEQLTTEFDEGKAKAAGTEGVRLGKEFLILPSGKPPSYRWHLQWAHFHLYLGRSQQPQKDSPNAYASISSETLWRNGVEGAVALVVHEVESLGGELLAIKPSRCDLAADFLIPGGVPHDLLLSLRVPTDTQHVHYMKGNRQETFYQGATSSPIQMRIYDKALEVLKGGTKLWFLEVWKLPTCESVWRVEFQLRRPCLNEFGVNSIPELRRSLPGLWKHLTERWFSLRLHDDQNVTRRTVHPWWVSVQCCDARFGEPQPLVRADEQSPADAQWFISHSAGCLLSYAARRRFGSFELAASELVADMRDYWSRKDFEEAYIEKSIKLGFVDCSLSPSEPLSSLGEAA